MEEAAEGAYDKGMEWAQYKDQGGKNMEEKRRIEKVGEGFDSNYFFFCCCCCCYSMIYP